METKKLSARGRPKKDYWDLKNKLAQEAAENKWKLGRWRPKKQRTIDDSLNTKISNHQKDINFLEKKNAEIHDELVKTNFSKHNIWEEKKLEEKTERYTRIALYLSCIVFIFSIIYCFLGSKCNKNDTLVFHEINPVYEVKTTSKNTEDSVQLQVWYNNESWEFVEMENISISNLNENIWESENVEMDDIATSDINLIKSFYENINNKNFSELSSMTDRYLKNSDSFRSYYNANWLNNFLNKIAGNKVFIGWFSERVSDKPNVRYYQYNIKYKVNGQSSLTEEDREIAIVDRNWERLIWSIMCITTWCSIMPFFQK